MAEGGRVLLLRHERPHADDATASLVMTMLATFLDELLRQEDPTSPIRSSSSGSGWRWQAWLRCAAAAGQSAPARTSSWASAASTAAILSSVELLPQHRPELRLLLAVPRADRTSGSGTGSCKGTWTGINLPKLDIQHERLRSIAPKPFVFFHAQICATVFRES